MLSNKPLCKLRLLAFIGVVGAVLKSAARPDVAPELAKQGRPAQALVPLSQAQPATHKSIDARVRLGTTLEDLLAELLTEVRTLDEDMKAFKLLNRALCAGYLQARKILNSGGGKPEKLP